jgi:hypothetical protein
MVQGFSLFRVPRLGGSTTRERNMDSKIKGLWIDALRSGEYVQGQNALKKVLGDETGFCCLGVLCDVAIKSGLDVKESEPSEYGTVSYDYATSYLPESVREWAGLTIGNPYVIFPTSDGTKRDVTLAGLNDGAVKDFGMEGTFEEIADMIEAQF